MSLNKAMVSSSRHDWGTPDEIFNPLNGRYKFTIDLFASPANALLPRYYSKDRDALTQNWGGERTFGNSPYGSFIRRAIKRAAKRDATCTILLMPQRACTRYWMDYVWPVAHCVHFLSGRITFKGAEDPAPFESALVVYLDGDRPKGDAKVVTGPIDAHPQGIEGVRALWV